MGGWAGRSGADRCPRRATLHVVSAHAGWLMAALTAACDNTIALRRYQLHPEPGDVSAGDMILVDLDTVPRTLDPVQLGQFSDRAVILGVAGDCDVPPAWLSWAYTRIVHVCQGGAATGVTGSRAVLSAVRRHFLAPHPEQVVRCVTEREPRLRRVGHFVAALYGDPYAVRRPRDLAWATHCSVAVIARQAKVLGFARSEHLLTAIRERVYQSLMDDFQQTRNTARVLAGVKDESNFRKQRRRVSHGVHPAPAPAKATGLLLLAMWSSLVQGCGGARGDDHTDSAAGTHRTGESALALPVVGAIARRGDLVLSVRATGVVRAERLVSIRPETQGVVSEVTVRPGERVPAGQVLARLDARPFDLAVREAESAVGSAQMQYTEAMLGTPDEDTSEAARTRRDNARLRSGIIAAEARLERARLDREHATIRAPFGGVLDEVGVVAGQRVGPGDLVARLVDLSALTVEAAVLEHDLTLMRVGAEATVTPSASRGTRLRGRVIAVLPLVDTTTRAGRVLVRVRTPDGALRPGMYADVELESTRLTGRVVVPAVAVIERDGRPLVFRARGGRAEWVYVVPGRSNGVEMEINPDSATSIVPIVPGDTVLTAGHLTLTHDAPIRVRLAGARVSEP